MVIEGKAKRATKADIFTSNPVTLEQNGAKIVALPLAASSPQTHRMGPNLMRRIIGYRASEAPLRKVIYRMPEVPLQARLHYRSALCFSKLLYDSEIRLPLTKLQTNQLNACFMQGLRASTYLQHNSQSDKHVTDDEVQAICREVPIAMHIRIRRLHYLVRLLLSDARFLQRLADDLWETNGAWNTMILDDIDWIATCMPDEEKPQAGFRHFIQW
eukprot:3675042-Pyramimonas_sp.AAC.1